MKVLFWADNQPILEMFKPIKALLDCESVIIRKVDSKVIEREKPDVLVVAREETTPLEGSIAGSEVKTLLVPHGALMPNERELWLGDGRYAKFRQLQKLLRQAYSKIVRNGFSLDLLKTGLFRMRNDFKDGVTLSRYDRFTKIAAYGDAMKDILLKYKVKPENIVITGNPKYNKYLDMKPNGRNKVLLITDYLVEFGLWSKKKRLNYLRDVCGAVSELTGENTDIAIHPVMEDKDEYKEIIKKNNLPADVYQMELPRLIEECSVAITLLSTGGLEAMVAGRPLIIYNPYDNPTMYSETGGAYVVMTKQELCETLKVLLIDGMDEIHRNLAEDFVYQQTYLRDGKADRRIVDLIVSMVNDK